MQVKHWLFNSHRSSNTTFLVLMFKEYSEQFIRKSWIKGKNCKNEIHTWQVSDSWVNQLNGFTKEFPKTWEEKTEEKFVFKIFLIGNICTKEKWKIQLVPDLMKSLVSDLVPNIWKSKNKVIWMKRKESC